MLRGIYTSASGMIVQMHKMDAVSNNMANVDLTGYKKDYTSNKSFPELLLKRLNTNVITKFPIGSIDKTPLVGKLGTGVELNEVYTDFQQGSLKESHNPLDLALAGKGFFAVSTELGERYTRNGSFTLDENGLLVNKEGFPVMGENGLIYLKQNNFKIDDYGNIYINPNYSDDPHRLVTMRENEWEAVEFLDKIKVVDFEQTRYLKKMGGSLWDKTENSGEPYIKNFQDGEKMLVGFLEASNVNSVQEMVKMIEINRAYEANQKSVKNHDELLSKLINETARV